MNLFIFCSAVTAMHRWTTLRTKYVKTFESPKVSSGQAAPDDLQTHMESKMQSDIEQDLSFIDNVIERRR